MESNRLRIITKTSSLTATNKTKSLKYFSHLHKFVIFLVITVLTGQISNVQAQNEIPPVVDTEPSHVVVLEGEQTSILCRSGLPIFYCRIKIPGEEVLNLRPEMSKPGFSYYGTGLSSGQCGVTIQRVSARNHGQVECNLGITTVESTGKINLTVALTPNRPEIEVITPRGSVYEVDQVFRARCIVRDGRPAANISWFLDNEPIYDGLGKREEITTIGDRNTTLITTVQEIQRILTPSDNGRTLICRATHIADHERPNETRFQFSVKYRPQPLPDVKVYGLTIGSTAIINVTVEANPRPRVEWTVDGVVIPQGTQNGRYEAYEPIDLGNGLYNVTLSVAGLTLEDTNKDYHLRALNDLGMQQYIVRISSSNTPASNGLDVGAIVGIVVAVLIILIAVLLIIFARATGRWCFAGKPSKTTTSETSDTESTEVKVSKLRKLPKFEALFMRKNEKNTKNVTKKDGTNNTGEQQNEDEQRLAGGTVTTNEQKDNDGNDNETKEDKQLVYAELVLKPSDESDKPVPTPKNSTEYAEIVYVQKGGQGQQKDEKNQSKNKEQSK